MAGRRRGPGFFRVIRFDKTLNGSRNALRYVAWRSEDVKGKEPCIFDDRSDAADVRSFMERLNDSVTRHPNAAKAYHTVFSLKREDFERAGMTDWRDVTRQVMRTYELETRRKLEWIASYHDNPTHPHCHVIIKAAYINENGQHKKLFLNRNEVQRVREITSRVLESRGLSLERQAPVRPPAPSRAPSLSGVGSFLAWLQQEMARQRREREREHEAEYRRWLYEQEREERDRDR